VRENDGHPDLPGLRFGAQGHLHPLVEREHAPENLSTGGDEGPFVRKLDALVADGRMGEGHGYGDASQRKRTESRKLAGEDRHFAEHGLRVRRCLPVPSHPRLRGGG
jgi:hypothetical protein